jgi:hypothetical protein
LEKLKLEGARPIGGRRGLCVRSIVTHGFASALKVGMRVDLVAQAFRARMALSIFALRRWRAAA